MASTPWDGLVLRLPQSHMADDAPLLAFIFSFSLEELKGNQQGIGDEYTRLLKTCRRGGLAVVGKRCCIPGTIIIFVDCHDNEKKNAIVRWEKCVRSVFLPNVFTADLNSNVASAGSFPTAPTSASDALLTPATVEPSRAAIVRALYTYLTLPGSRGGLDLSPGSHKYPHLKLLLSPHPPQFRSAWIKKLIGDLSFGYSEGDIVHMGALVSPELFCLTWARLQCAVAVWGTHRHLFLFSNALHTRSGTAGCYWHRTTLRGSCALPTSLVQCFSHRLGDRIHRTMAS